MVGEEWMNGSEDIADMNAILHETKPFDVASDGLIAHITWLFA